MDWKWVGAVALSREVARGFHTNVCSNSGLGQKSSSLRLCTIPSLEVNLKFRYEAAGDEAVSHGTNGGRAVAVASRHDSLDRFSQSSCSGMSAYHKEVFAAAARDVVFAL